MNALIEELLRELDSEYVEMSKTLYEWGSKANSVEYAILATEARINLEFQVKLKDRLFINYQRNVSIPLTAKSI